MSDLGTLYYINVVAMVVIGLYIVLTKRNVLKILIGLDILGTGVNLLIVVIGYIKGGTAPIYTAGISPAKFVDPLPQALVLTAIVIDAAVLAMAISIAIRLYREFGTLDVRKMRLLKW